MAIDAARYGSALTQRASRTCPGSRVVREIRGFAVAEDGAIAAGRRPRHPADRGCAREALRFKTDDRIGRYVRYDPARAEPVNAVKRILRIEDNDQLREEIATVLEVEGFVVDTVTNGRIGLERIAEERPDLIVCDVMVPEIDGLEAPPGRHVAEHLLPGAGGGEAVMPW